MIDFKSIIANEISKVVSINQDEIKKLQLAIKEIYIYGNT